jgi:prophage maintenance system killer protein
MVAFLDRNGHEPTASDGEVVEVVLSVAAGDPTDPALAAAAQELEIGETTARHHLSALSDGRGV